MKLKANHNLLLPDGKTEIGAGDIFDYKGDISSFQDVVEVISTNSAPEKKEPTEKPEMPAITPEDEEIIRAKAKELGIKKYYNKGLANLLKEIEEKAAETPEPVDGDAPTPAEDEKAGEKGEEDAETGK